VTAHTVTLTPKDSLRDAVAAAEPDTTILLEDGTYLAAGLTGGLVLSRPRTVVRGASGDRTKVILDGGGQQQVVSVTASDVVLADLSIVNSSDTAVHIESPSGIMKRVALYRLRVVDINKNHVHAPGIGGRYTDDSVIGCSSFSITDSFRSALKESCALNGLNLNGITGWHLFSNDLTGFWCPSAHFTAIQVAYGSRDVLVERNRILNSGQGIRMGITAGSGTRLHPGACSSTTSPVDNVGGVLRNNFIAARAGVTADSGLMVWNSCDTVVAHNTVAFADAPYTCIEWREAVTTVRVINNLVSHNLMARDGATAWEAGNVTDALSSTFVDLASGDLHLTAGAVKALDQGAVVEPSVCSDDIDGQPRTGQPDVGADER